MVLLKETDGIRSMARKMDCFSKLLKNFVRISGQLQVVANMKFCHKQFSSRCTSNAGNLRLTGEGSWEALKVHNHVVIAKIRRRIFKSVQNRPLKGDDQEKRTKFLCFHILTQHRVSSFLKMFKNQHEGLILLPET